MEQSVIGALSVPIAALLLAASAWPAGAQDAPAHYVTPWVQLGLGEGGAMTSTRCDADRCGMTAVGTFGAGLDIGSDWSVAAEASNHTGMWFIVPSRLHAHLRMFSVRYHPFRAPIHLKAGVGAATYDALGLPRSRSRVVGEIGIERSPERRIYQFLNVSVGTPASVDIAPGVAKGSRLMGVEAGVVMRLHIG